MSALFFRVGRSLVDAVHHSRVSGRRPLCYAVAVTASRSAAQMHPAERQRRPHGDLRQRQHPPCPRRHHLPGRPSPAWSGSTAPGTFAGTSARGGNGLPIEITAPERSDQDDLGAPSGLSSPVPNAPSRRYRSLRIGTVMTVRHDRHRGCRATVRLVGEEGGAGDGGAKDEADRLDLGGECDYRRDSVSGGGCWALRRRRLNPWGGICCLSAGLAGLRGC